MPLQIISSMLNGKERNELISKKGSLLHGGKEKFLCVCEREPRGGGGGEWTGLGGDSVGVLVR